MKITDINDPKVPQWFRDAQKSNQKWYYDTNANKIVWQSGTWQDGNWLDGTWYNGTWKKGIWLKGTWKWGWWQDGTWQKGNWQKGTWSKGTWKKGTWYDGTWNDGTWKHGTWQGGWIYDPDEIGNYQNNQKWRWNNEWVHSLINPKQYFKNSHIPRQLRLINNLQKYMKMSDQQLVKLIGKNSVQQWLDEWYYDQFNKQQFLIQHKDDLNQSIIKLVRNK